MYNTGGIYKKTKLINRGRNKWFYFISIMSSANINSVSYVDVSTLSFSVFLLNFHIFLEMYVKRLCFKFQANNLVWLSYSVRISFLTFIPAMWYCYALIVITSLSIVLLNCLQIYVAYIYFSTVIYRLFWKHI